MRRMLNTDIIDFTFTVVLITFITNMSIALYGLFVKPSLFKKVVSLIIFSDSMNILIIAIGYVVPRYVNPSPPVHSKLPSLPEEIQFFARTAVDPLPQAFVITAVVIGLSVIVFMLSLVVKYCEHYGSGKLTLFQEVENEDTI